MVPGHCECQLSSLKAFGVTLIETKEVLQGCIYVLEKQISCSAEKLYRTLRNVQEIDDELTDPIGCCVYVLELHMMA